MAMLKNNVDNITFFKGTLKKSSLESHLRILTIKGNVHTHRSDRFVFKL